MTKKVIIPRTKKTITKTVKVSEDMYTRVVEKAQKDFGFNFAELTRYFMAKYLENDNFEQRKTMYVEGLIRDSNDIDKNPQNYKKYNSGEDLVQDMNNEIEKNGNN